MPTRDIDLQDPSTYLRGVPHDQFEVLRREAPIYFQSEPNGPGYWAVLKHADVVAVSRTAAARSSRCFSTSDSASSRACARLAACRSASRAACSAATIAVRAASQSRPKRVASDRDEASASASC